MNYCPHCNTPLDLESNWSGRDYDSYFRIECHCCEKPIAVTVHPIPEFEINKAKCEWCNKVEVNDINTTYCTACQEKLSQLSAHNQKRAKEVT